MNPGNIETHTYEPWERHVNPGKSMGTQGKACVPWENNVNPGKGMSALGKACEPWVKPVNPG